MGNRSLSMTIDLVFITYNRLEYTKLALASVLAEPTEEFSLTIWDNASTDGTVEYLRKKVHDPRIADIVFSKKNIGQTAAVNEVWGRSSADLLGKLDNDCLVTPGWTRTLAKAHEDIPNLGVIACWHFFPQDFDYERAKQKIQNFNGHQIFRHPWTCGTGLLIKRKTYKKFGPIQNQATTRYWLKMAMSGYINGFYYPFIYQEHMDDPLSQHTLLRDDADVRRAHDITYTLRSHHINAMAERMERRKLVLANLLDDPWDPKHYVGWRRRLKRVGSIPSKLFTKSLRRVGWSV